MSSLLFLSLFLIFGLALFIIGLVASRGISSHHDFFLAGRNLGLATVTFSLIATQLGGGMILGIGQKAYTLGILGAVYAFGMALGFLLLSLGFAGKLRGFNVATNAELFHVLYKSPRLKKIASLISAATLTGLLLGQVAASRTLLVGLNIHNEYLFILIWALIIIYTMAGGLQAVAMVDSLQVVFIIIMFGGVFLYSLWSQPSFAFGNLAQTQSLFTSGFDITTIVPIFVMPALFSLIEQDLAQRFFAAQSQRIAILAALFAGIFLMIFAGVPAYFGMQAKLLGLSVTRDANPLVIALEYLVNPFVLSLCVVGIMAAITSTADSLLCAISSHIQDFDFAHKGTDKEQVRLSKIATLIIGSTVFLSSYLFHQAIIDILVESYTLAVSTLFVPIFACFIKKRFNAYAAGGSMLAGFIGFIVFSFVHTSVPAGILPLACSFIGYLIGSLI